jgi:hypothetical protein
MNSSTRTRKSLALICAIMFVPSLVFALVATNLEKSLFDPRLYKDAIKAAHVYEQLPGLIGAQIEANAANNSELAGLFVGALPPGTMQNMFVSILPPELLQSMVEGAIDQALAYVNGQSGQAEVGLGSLNEQLASNSDGLVDQYFSTLPDCTLFDALSFAGGLVGGGDSSAGSTGTLPKCNPPDAVREAVAAPLQAALQKQLGEIFPTSVSLASGEGGLGSLFSALRWVRVAAELTPLIAFVLFGLMLLLAVRTGRELLRWWGIPLLIGGVLALLAGVLIGPATGGFLNFTLLSRLSASVAPALAQLLAQVTAAIASGIARPIMLDALLVSALGGGLLIAARFAPNEEAV